MWDQQLYTRAYHNEMNQAMKVLQRMKQLQLKLPYWEFHFSQSCYTAFRFVTEKKKQLQKPLFRWH